MKKKNLIRLQDITFGTIAVSSLFVLFGASGANATTSSVDSVSIEVPVACTMTSTVNTAHTATANVGTYQENIGETTFNVICNDANGFSVYAIGYTNDEFGNTTMKPSILPDTNAIATGTATSGNTSNWAMKLTAVTGDYSPTLETGFNAYHAVPAEYTKVASFASNTDSSTGSSFKSTYAAFVASAQPADTYTGKVKYTVVHPAAAAAPMSSISQVTTMQEFSGMSLEEKTSVVASMVEETDYTLLDIRDNKTYHIAKLKDGNVWMMENLDLGRTDLTVDLTSENSNISETISANTFNNWRKTSGSESYTSSEFVPLSTSNTTNNLDTDPISDSAYGTLYNYCAVSGETVCGSSNEKSALYDICPAGWRLPTGGSGDNAEFKNLYSTYGSSYSKMRTSIADGGLAFTLAGYFISSVSNQGTFGHYWSSSYGNSIYMSNMELYESGVSYARGDNRYYGFSARCILKKPAHNLTFTYGAGVSSVTFNGVAVQNGGVVRVEEGIPYSIIINMIEGYDLLNWSVTSGTLSGSTSKMPSYAIGFEDATLTANTMPTIQGIDSANCTATASQVMDSRDKHIYTIQRLADGRCWMMENLEFGRNGSTGSFSTSNTNAPDIVGYYNNWKKTAITSTDTAGVLVLEDGTDSTSGAPYGVLYNYYAASAGTISGSNNDNAINDICPAKWRLPTGGNNGEFNALYNTYHSSANMRASIANDGAQFTLSGRFSGTASSDIGTNGYYWTSKYYDSSDMYIMTINESGVSFDGHSSRNNGASIRCILDESSISDLSYMQDFGIPAVGNSVRKTMPIGVIYNLIDNRDNKTYQIAKLKDGNIWMVENLDLGRTELTVDLTRNNTSLTSAVTAATFNGWKKSISAFTYDAGEFISLDTTNTTDGRAVDVVSGTPYGTLYNFYAISAGTISGSSNTTVPKNNICPAGWDLPAASGYYTGHFQTLNNLEDYNTAAKMRAPVTIGGAQFALAGYVVSGYANSTGAPMSNGGTGGYWTRSQALLSDKAKYILSLSSSSMSPASSGDRKNLYSARCLVR